MLTGKWTYRIFRNEPGLISGDASAALALINGEGVFDLEMEGSILRGGLGMGLDHALALRGTVTPGHEDAPLRFSMIGEGMPGTPTEGWRYDYRGEAGHLWPNAVDQRPSLVGTVIRVHAHGPDAPAGATASFIAVRQPPPPPRAHRSFALMADL
ncbi:hypothetical protein [Sphingomonas sp. PR090111-T3T-6A]|uniref:hypothetical protein n=1 Tax=Sphingomonas sp. PR090111-T3T-6A TaxID=685778 RepID=UPI0003788DDC|nr:hypothetical protein [Sphingomonas sp. PR090111-T3T-6A]